MFTRNYAPLSTPQVRPSPPMTVIRRAGALALVGLLACGCGQKAPPASPVAAVAGPGVAAPAKLTPTGDVVDPGPTGPATPATAAMSRLEIARALAAKGKPQPVAAPLATFGLREVTLPSHPAPAVPVGDQRLVPQNP